KNVDQAMSTMCTQYTPNTYSRFECQHGIGHGLMYYTGNDVPHSLQKCDTFSGTFDQDACYSGVYMENFNSDETMHPSKYLYTDDPFRLCLEHAKYQDECYNNAPFYFLNKH